MVQTSLWDASYLQHVLPRFRGAPDALPMHVELFDKLLETRAMSMAAFHLLPPHCYDHSLAPELEVAARARDSACKHWSMLLEAESAQNQGVFIGPLQYMHWRHNPLIRTLFLAYEEDRRAGREGAADSAAWKLQTVLARHPGDSRLIEVAHQKAKDVFRSSKQNTFSNTRIMAQILASNVLEKRGLQVAKGSTADKVIATPPKHVRCLPVTKLMRASSHKLPRSMQEVMVPKGKKEEWPSPSPGALFQSSAATEWLMHFWMEKQNDQWPPEVDVNSAWISILVQPGSCVAQKSTASVMKVVAAAEYSFLAWELHVRTGPSGETCFVCRPERSYLKWKHITALEDWVVLPTQAVLLNELTGPVAWKKSAPAISLHAAACLAGLPLTVAQMKDLIVVLGGDKPSGNVSRKEVEDILWTMSFPELDLERAKAEAKATHASAAKEDEIDSEFSEVLSELDDDEANKQDLKDMTSIKKRAKMMRKMAAKQQNVPVAAPKKRKGKGNGKGRGSLAKGNGKGRGRGSLPSNRKRHLVDSLLARARKASKQSPWLEALKC